MTVMVDDGNRASGEAVFFCKTVKPAAFRCLYNQNRIGVSVVSDVVSTYLSTIGYLCSCRNFSAVPIYTAPPKQQT